MLLAFRVANHKSIRDEVELSLVRSSRMATRSASGTDRYDLPSPVAAVYGSNASGKSNLVDAMTFMASAVRDSYGRWPVDGPIPISPFALGGEHANGPSTFEVEVLLEGVRYQYGFALGREAVREEWLYAYPRGRRQTWFERNSSTDDEFHFGTYLTGKNKLTASLTGHTTLFLSTAAESNHARLRPLARWFVANLRTARPVDEAFRQLEAMRLLAHDDRAREQITTLLQFADLGLRGIELIPREVMPRGFRERITELSEAFDSLVAAAGTTSDLPSLSKVLDDDMEYTVQLEHSGTKGHLFSLPFSHESRGTQALVALAVPALAALDHGGTLVVDELDTSMHPRLVAEVVRLFQSPDTNPRNAQLVFTSHDTSLMGSLSGEDSMLARDQIWFTEKDAEGVTRLYPLTDFSPRKLENLQRGYLQGRYGAVPHLDRQELRPLLTEDH